MGLSRSTGSLCHPRMRWILPSVGLPYRWVKTFLSHVRHAFVVGGVNVGLKKLGKDSTIDVITVSKFMLCVPIVFFGGDHVVGISAAGNGSK